MAFLGRHSTKIRLLGLTNILRSTVRNTAFGPEPEYLKLLKPQVPVYELVNVQVKGYDFTVIEHYCKHIHKIAVNMDFDVEDGWATPHQALHVTNKEVNSTKVSHDYHLQLYERNIQISDFAAYSAPVFCEIVQSLLPAGVSVSVHPHDPSHEEIRYIPDFDLISRKMELNTLEGTIDEDEVPLLTK